MLCLDWTSPRLANKTPIGNKSGDPNEITNEGDHKAIHVAGHLLLMPPAKLDLSSDDTALSIEIAVNVAPQQQTQLFWLGSCMLAHMKQRMLHPLHTRSFLVADLVEVQQQVYPVRYRSHTFVDQRHQIIDDEMRHYRSVRRCILVLYDSQTQF